MTPPALPEVVCTSCGKHVGCKQVPDGTIYKPTAWLYPDPKHPMRGVCTSCRRAAELGMRPMGRGLTREQAAADPGLDDILRDLAKPN